jgi:hypothetical protein
MLTNRQLDKMKKATSAELDKVIQSTPSYHILSNLQYSQMLYYYPPQGGTKESRKSVDMPYLVLNYPYLRPEDKLFLE